MTEQQVAAIAQWLTNNEKRPISFIERELLKSAIDGSYTVGDLVRALSALANKR